MGHTNLSEALALKNKSNYIVLCRDRTRFDSIFDSWPHTFVDGDVLDVVQKAHTIISQRRNCIFISGLCDAQTIRFISKFHLKSNNFGHRKRGFQFHRSKFKLMIVGVGFLNNICAMLRSVSSFLLSLLKYE